MAVRATENEPTYNDVARLVYEMRDKWGRSTSWRLDPDFYKAGGQDVMRYWVVAECWKAVRDKTHTQRAGQWFRGAQGYYTMAGAMYYALMAVHIALEEAAESAERQASF